MLVKLRQPQKPLQHRLAHLQNIAEAHVVLHQRNDLLGIFIGKTQPPQNLLRHPHSNLNMSVKADAIARLLRIGRPESRGLSNIVQQRAPCERRRNPRSELLQEQHRMHPHNALRMKLRRLFHAMKHKEDWVPLEVTALVRPANGTSVKLPESVAHGTGH